MALIAAPINTCKRKWTPIENIGASSLYQNILLNASTVATIIDPLTISGYHGDIFSSDTNFTLSGTKQGVTISGDMETITPGTGIVFHLFVSDFNAGPTDTYGIGITPVSTGVYDIAIGDPFDSMNQTIVTSVAITPSDKVTLAIDNTGTYSCTVYAYLNGVLVGSHVINAALDNPLIQFGTFISCESPAITLTCDDTYAISGVTNYINTSGSGTVDIDSYPLDRKNAAFEISGLSSPLLSAKGYIDNGNIAYFDFAGDLNYIGGQTITAVESVTTSDSIILVDNTDPFNPVLSASLPVDSIVAGTNIGVVESPSGTFTISNTQTVPPLTDVLTTSITDGDTTHAPTSDAVYDALDAIDSTLSSINTALSGKAPSDSPYFTGNVSAVLDLNSPGSPTLNLVSSDTSTFSIKADIVDYATNPSSTSSVIYNLSNTNNPSKTRLMYSQISQTVAATGTSLTLQTFNTDAYVSNNCVITLDQSGVLQLSGSNGVTVNGSTLSGSNTGDQNLSDNQHKYLTNISSASGVLTVDCSTTSSLFTTTLTENITSWSFTNLPTSGEYIDIELLLTQGSSSYSCVSPATLTAGGTWTISSVTSSKEYLAMRVFSDGSVHLFPSGVML